MSRYFLLFCAMAACFMVLGLKLWHLQIINGEKLRARSENNRTEIIDLPPLRGLISDRDGTVMVDNQASFDLCVVKSDVKDSEKLIAEVASLTGRNVDDLKTVYEAMPNIRRLAQPWVIGLSKEELVVLETRRHRLEGVNIRVGSVRLPIYGVLASHVLGYMGEISKEDLDKERYSEQHRAGDWIGKSGIEQSMEGYLKGRRGYKIQEVDSRRQVLKVGQVQNPEPGYNLRLTIDSRLQAKAQELLGERAGAIVVMDPRNFEILTLASSPTYDLSDFIGGIKKERWKSLAMDDSFHPLQNRAVAGQYPPGSTYKIVTSLAALAEGVITPETTFYCRGALKLGSHSFGCWNRRGHGAVNLHRSLMVSCDVYYYEVGRRMGVDPFAKRTREFFGLGRRLGVDLLAEQPGLIPDSDWKMRRFKEKWMPGEILPVSIGQGYVLSTPLQVAQFTAVLANGGHLYRPHLVKEITDVNGQTVKAFDAELISSIDIKPEYIKAVQKGVEAVVNEGGGTGRRGRLPKIKVAGKTGTSQVVSLKKYQGYAKSRLPYKFKDHAWFTSYAPAENPEVVVTVLLEHTGGGGVNAAPVAQQMLEAYFDKSIVTLKLPPPQVQPDNPTGWNPKL